MGKEKKKKNGGLSLHVCLRGDWVLLQLPVCTADTESLNPWEKCISYCCGGHFLVPLITPLPQTGQVLEHSNTSLALHCNCNAVSFLFPLFVSRSRSCTRARTKTQRCAAFFSLTRSCAGLSTFLSSVLRNNRIKVGAPECAY